MKFKVYKVISNGSKIHDVGVYPTLKEAQAAASKEVELDEKELKEFFGFKTVVVEKENYVVKFINAAKHWCVWWYGAKPVDE